MERRLNLLVKLQLLYLLRGWLVLVMAGASRQNGSELLSLFYPHKMQLVYALLSGSLALILGWLSGYQDSEKTPKRAALWRLGYWPLVLALTVDVGFQLWQLLHQFTPVLTTQLALFAAGLALWVIAVLSPAVRRAFKRDDLSWLRH